MTASEASRNFSALLDEAERGEAIVVTRSGRRVALIVPAPRANGRALKDVFGAWRDRAGIDDDFAARVASVRDTVSADLDEDPWRD